MTTIDEPIHVNAVFRAGQVHPLWFVWAKRRYPVREVTLRWHTRQGREEFSHLAVVTAQGDMAELTFNHQTLMWHLARTEAD